MLQVPGVPRNPAGRLAAAFIEFPRSQGDENLYRFVCAFAFVLSLMPWTSNALAGSTVYRCVDGAKTVLTDTPCPNSGPVVETPSVTSGSAGPIQTLNVNAAYETPYGEWRGQVQYQATEKGQRVETAHAVVPVVLVIANDNKVSGFSKDNGCKYLGIASPGFTSTLLNLDLSLKNCAYGGLNRRYSGTLLVNPSSKVAQLSLSGLDARFGSISSYDLKATLRR